jgi:hypothetical protein
MIRPGYFRCFLVCSFSLFVLAGCATDQNKKGKNKPVAQPVVNVYTPGNLPPNAMPPKGQCRIWHTDGSLGPIGKCKQLEKQLEKNPNSGAQLIRGN